MSMASFPRLPGHSNQSLPRSKAWYPRALSWWFLVATIAVCWAFIAILQYFLAKSQNEGGVVFAPNINNLPLRRSFVFLYMPTVIAVIFSIFIAWIDLDAKRYEPYHQLSKANGALGEDSLLLRYPFDFIPLVPFFALKRGHWIVFWASLAAVLTTFGIVPLQAGIFSTTKVTQTSPASFIVSQKFIHTSEQEAKLTLSYTQSAYGIVSLNDTLPPFMALNYTLAPFTALSSERDSNSTWTAETMLYGYDGQCEEAIIGFNEDGDTFHSSDGCDVKSFSAYYMGSYSLYDDYYGMPAPFGDKLCPGKGNGTFFSALVRNKEREEDPPNKPTAIFCKPSYFEQRVTATVDAFTQSPISIVELEPRQPISPELFNATDFETTVSYGSRLLRTRHNNLPAVRSPRYFERLVNTDLSSEVDGYGFQLPSIAAMAMTITNHTLEELLDPKQLAEAYGAAYRLLFVRSMVDILRTDFLSATKEISGLRHVETEALIFEPSFTYIVEALLGIVSISAIALLSPSVTQRRQRKLVDDPGTIAAVMSMVSSSTPLLSSFHDLDSCSTKYMQQKLRLQRYKLSSDSSHCCIVEVTPPQHTLPKVDANENHLAKPMRPSEFRLFIAIPFVSVFLALLIALAALYSKNIPNGLRLPSKSRVIQNIVREYLPTATGSLIELMWILINRLLCMLQPLEELQNSRARASRSIDLNYNSLPPQLTVLKALRSGHLMLAAVCGMTLLANLLSTTFAGLLIQETLPLTRVVSFSPPFDAKIVNINGSVGPPVDERPMGDFVEYSGAYQGGIGEDQFLVAESNYTRNTSLPSWTDETAMYLPFLTSGILNQDIQGRHEARTKYFNSELNCKPRVFGRDYELRLWNNDTVTPGEPIPPMYFHMDIEDGNGATVRCYERQIPGRNPFAYGLGRVSRDPYDDTCRLGSNAAELLEILAGGPKATRHQQEICSSTIAIGWMRTRNANCSDDETWFDPPEDFEDVDENNTLMISCQPKLTVGDATVIVDANGLLQVKAKDHVPEINQTPKALQKYFSSGVATLLHQSNLFLFRSYQSTYHNDSFASEYFHYFVNRAANSLQFTDPNLPLPTFAEIEEPIKKAYTRLFAIWLGVNKELLFLPASTATPKISGTTTTLEERLIFKKNLFIISEVILGIYIIVSITIYFRRPGRYLARIPMTIGAVIALFAASAAVKDMEGSSTLNVKDRRKFLEDMDCRYGYGSYVGGDGGVHIGVEKVPYVRKMEHTRFEHSRFDIKLRRRGANGGNTTNVGVQSAPVGGNNQP
ncbi:hypothetical protein IQ07DRAFT_672697 [Pyrenochaeta sp. DS3sAY3a]|nr:hypothetical protein IQ07DRAFT_672697 [Pyrenochaeta sp. DS3sAY3a]